MRKRDPRALATLRSQTGIDTRRPRGRRTSAEAVATPVPPLTRELADQFVKCLSAGLPAATAFAYCAPDVSDPRHASTALAKWLNDPLLVLAVNALNGGEWHELEPDRRLEVALDKHFAELAYYLWSHNFAVSDGAELAKLIEARKAITEKMKLDSGEGEDTPFVKAMRDLVSGALGDAAPPLHTAIPVPTPKH